MKVAHLTSVHPRNDVRIFHKQCKSLVEAGYLVTLVVADGLGCGRQDGIRVYDVGKSSGRFNRVLNATRRVLRKAIDIDADIYHIHDPELLWAGVQLKKIGKLVIFDAHEDVPIQLLNKPYLTPFLLRVLSRCYSWIQDYACKRFDGIVTATPFIRDKFFRINYQTVDVCNYPVLGEFSSRVDWADKADEVCYVGGLSRARGIREIVLANSSVPGSTQLNLVGEFTDNNFREELRYTEAWDKVIEHGFLSREGVAQVYQRCFAGLVVLHPLSNYIDALPIKMFEYMSAGIPVIASDFPCWSDIVNESGCGVCVSPLDTGAISGAISYLKSNPEIASRMGEKGRQAVVSKYNWQNEKLKLLKFYRDILTHKDI